MYIYLIVGGTKCETLVLRKFLFHITRIQQPNLVREHTFNNLELTY